MILKTSKQNDYELIDSGLGQKLERFGQYSMIRPDPEALWQKNKPERWANPDFEFVRVSNQTKWISKHGTPKSFNITFGELNFIIKPTSFKHTGLFPEQLPHLQWMEKIITNHKSYYEDKKIQVLNLFAYTGGATLACARAGAEVCHVDGSKNAVKWARDNADLSGLADAPIRWIIDDCLLFLKRETKRGRKYDAIIMDPPSFGHGPKDELWKIESNFLELMDLCQKILSENPLFVLMNGYTAGYSPITYQNNLMTLMSNHMGQIEIGELAIGESTSPRLLPCGIFARWKRN